MALRRIAAALLAALAGGCATPPPLDAELPRLDIATLQQRLRSGELGCRTLIAAVLARSERLEQRGPALNALIALNPQALATAEALDAQRRSGARLGAAHCLPVVVKDNIDTAELPTTEGSPLFAGWRPAQDAAVVARLRAAGAVVVAKSGLDDFAAAVHGISSIGGAMRNPHAPDRTVGGSSGGSAIAVAAGYVPLAIGTDAGGSLRIPASFTGTVTIRPTIGLVSRRGILPRSRSQDTAGPIARSVADAAAGLDLIASPEGAEAAVPPEGYAAHAGVRHALRGARIGLVRDGLALFGGTAPAIGELLSQAADDLRAAGADVIALPPPDATLLGAASVITFESRRDVDAYLAAAGPAAPVHDFLALVASRAYTAAAGESLAREAAVDPATLESDPAYRQALAARQALRAYTLQVLVGHRLDAIVYASATRFAGPLGSEPRGVFTRWSENTGFPALALPMGLGRDDGPPLPVNLEWLGPPFGEPRLIELAADYEARQPRREAPPFAR